MDDTNVSWPHSGNDLDKFVGDLNGQFEHINFAIVLEENQTLPLLNLLVSKNSNASLDYQI